MNDLMNDLLLPRPETVLAKAATRLLGRIRQTLNEGHMRVMVSSEEAAAAPLITVELAQAGWGLKLEQAGKNSILYFATLEILPQGEP